MACVRSAKRHVTRSCATDPGIFHTHTAVYTHGQRTGKAYLASALLLYAEHKMLTLDVAGKRVTPSAYFGLVPGCELRATYIGTCIDVALDSYRCIVAQWRSKSPWFSSYLTFLKAEAERIGLPTFAETGSSFVYLHRDLRTTVEQANKMLLRGPTRYFACWVDAAYTKHEVTHELLPETELHDIRDSLSNSLRTVNLAVERSLLMDKRLDVSAAHAVIMSTLRPSECFMSSLERASLLNRRMYASRKSTWAINYNEREDELRSAPAELFANMYACQEPA